MNSMMRRRFFRTLIAPLGLAILPAAAAVKPKPSVFLRKLEQEYDPALGMLGRSKLARPLTFDELRRLDTTGYERLQIPGTPLMDYPIYNSAGFPTTILARYYVREDGGKRYVVCVNYSPLSRRAS